MLFVFLYLVKTFLFLLVLSLFFIDETDSQVLVSVVIVLIAILLVIMFGEFVELLFLTFLVSPRCGLNKQVHDQTQKRFDHKFDLSNPVIKTISNPVIKTITLIKESIQ